MSGGRGYLSDDERAVIDAIRAIDSNATSGPSSEWADHGGADLRRCFTTEDKRGLRPVKCRPFKELPRVTDCDCGEHQPHQHCNLCGGIVSKGSGDVIAEWTVTL